jgi:hypothetical protein
MVKVYGYYRSGNNFLLQSLIKNFKFENIETTINSAKEYERFKNTFHFDSLLQNSLKYNQISSNVWVHPYGGLIGGHHKSNFDPTGIYIIRNPRDVMFSFWKVSRNPGEFEQWCSLKQLNLWKEHLNHHLGIKFFYIKYEDLRDNFQSTMKKISSHFNLSPISDSYVSLDTLVGWGPLNNKEKLEGKTRESKDFSNDLNKRFQPYVDFYLNIK